MRYRGRGIGHGNAEGEILLSKVPISFLGGVDPNHGEILDSESDVRGSCFSGKILVFPHGKGSTVGSYVIYQLKKSGSAPAAIVNQKADTVVATGAILSSIPMLHSVPIGIFAQGDYAKMSADEEYIELPEVEERPVVTVIIRNKGKILLLRRSDKVASFQGHWAGVSGSISSAESPKLAAIREIEEETSLRTDSYTIVAEAQPIFARAEKIVWKVHPFLVEIMKPDISIDWEHDKYEWASADEIRSFNTVPRLEEVIEVLLKEEGRTAGKKC